MQNSTWKKKRKLNLWVIYGIKLGFFCWLSIFSTHLATVVCVHAKALWILYFLDLQKSAFGVDSSFCCSLSLFAPCTSLAVLSLSSCPSLFFCSLRLKTKYKKSKNPKNISKFIKFEAYPKIRSLGYNELFSLTIVVNIVVESKLFNHVSSRNSQLLTCPVMLNRLVNLLFACCQQNCVN